MWTGPRRGPVHMRQVALSSEFVEDSGLAERALSGSRPSPSLPAGSAFARAARLRASATAPARRRVGSDQKRSRPLRATARSLWPAASFTGVDGNALVRGFRRTTFTTIAQAPRPPRPPSSRGHRQGSSDHSSPTEAAPRHPFPRRACRAERRPGGLAAPGRVPPLACSALPARRGPRPAGRRARVTAGRQLKLAVTNRTCPSGSPSIPSAPLAAGRGLLLQRRAATRGRSGQPCSPKDPIASETRSASRSGRGGPEASPSR